MSSEEFFQSWFNDYEITEDENIVAEDGKIIFLKQYYFKNMTLDQLTNLQSQYPNYDFTLSNQKGFVTLKERISLQEFDQKINQANLLMCDKEAIEVQKILPFLSDTWPLCRIGRAVIRASQSCRQSCNKSQCPACGCRSHHSCTHAPQFSRSFPAREWGSVLQRQGACGQCP